MAIAQLGTPVGNSGATGNTFTGLTTGVPTSAQGVTDPNTLLKWTIFGVATAIADIPTPTGWSVWQANITVSTNMKAAEFYRYASAEPASYTVTGLTGGRYAGIIRAYTGVDPTTPQDVTPTTASSTSGMVAPAAITPVTSGAWIDCVNAAITTAAVAVASWTSSNMTKDVDGATANTTLSNASGGLAHFAWTSGAFTPNLTQTSTTSRGAGITSAIRPQTVFNVSLTGVAADLALTAPAGSVAVDLGGEVADLAYDAPIGTATLASNIDGAGATSDLALTAPAGTLTLTGSVTLTGVAADLALAAPAGTLGIDVSLTGVVSDLALGAPTGTLALGADVALTGEVSDLALGAPAGTVTPSSTVLDVSLVGAVSDLALGAPAGTFVGTVDLAGVPSDLALASPAGTVSASSTVLDVSLTGVPSTLDLAALAGTASMVSLVSLVGVVSDLALTAPGGTSVTFSNLTAQVALTAAVYPRRLTAGSNARRLTAATYVRKF